MKALFLWALAFGIPVVLTAQSVLESAGYHLAPRDLLRVTVYGEPDLSNIERRVDGNGAVSMPLLGSVTVGGLTTPAAEDRIRQMYVEKEIFSRPQVSVAVVEYVSREVSVLGQVREPGRIKLPNEADRIQIVEAITRAGGLTRLARADSVRVTRKGADGSERSFLVNVDRMINGRGGAEPFELQPGDVIFIPERMF